MGHCPFVGLVNLLRKLYHAQVVDTGLPVQQDWQPVPKTEQYTTPVFRNAPVANEADRVALKEKRPPLPPIKRPLTPPTPRAAIAQQETKVME